MPGSNVLDPSITVRTFTGSDLIPYLDEVARLRIEVFRAYPYLYQGSMAYEQEYLQTYMSSPDAAIVIASEGDTVIGASTCIPLQAEPAYVQAPFIANGFDVQQFYYYGESVLLPEYRRKGVGVAFFEHRERKARSLEHFKWVCFCGVERSVEHPLRPADYVPLNYFWRRRGFQETDMFCEMTWKDINEEQESSKPLRFWIKEL